VGVDSQTLLHIDGSALQLLLGTFYNVLFFNQSTSPGGAFVIIGVIVIHDGKDVGVSTYLKEGITARIDMRPGKGRITTRRQTEAPARFYV
jgi:hypothetical protein